MGVGEGWSRRCAMAIAGSANAARLWQKHGAQCAMMEEGADQSLYRRREPKAGGSGGHNDSKTGAFVYCERAIQAGVAEWMEDVEKWR